MMLQTNLAETCCIPHLWSTTTVGHEPYFHFFYNYSSNQMPVFSDQITYICHRNLVARRYGHLEQGADFHCSFNFLKHSNIITEEKVSLPKCFIKLKCKFWCWLLHLYLVQYIQLSKKLHLTSLRIFCCFGRCEICHLFITHILRTLWSGIVYIYLKWISCMWVFIYTYHMHIHVWFW
jgi:hypothetical protein